MVLNLRNKRIDKKDNTFNGLEMSQFSPFQEQIYHQHDGIDQLRINPKDLLGFPVYAAVPTHKTEEGTFVTANISGIVYVYLMMNKVWNLVGKSPSSYSSTTVIDFGTVTPHNAIQTTVTLTGAVVGQPVILGVADTVISSGSNCANITFFAWVSATNTVTVRCLNNDSALTANPASGNFITKIMNI